MRVKHVLTYTFIIMLFFMNFISSPAAALTYSYDDLEFAEPYDENEFEEPHEEFEFNKPYSIVETTDTAVPIIPIIPIYQVAGEGLVTVKWQDMGASEYCVRVLDLMIETDVIEYIVEDVTCDLYLYSGTTYELSVYPMEDGYERGDSITCQINIIAEYDGVYNDNQYYENSEPGNQYNEQYDSEESTYYDSGYDQSYDDDESAPPDYYNQEDLDKDFYVEDTFPEPATGRITSHGIRIDNIKSYSGDTVIINRSDNILDWTASGDVSHYYIRIEDLTLGEYAVNPQETQSSGMSLLGEYLETGHVYRVTVGVIPINGTIDDAEWDNLTFEVEETRETPYDPGPTTEPTPEETPEPTPYIGTITYHGIRIENIQSYIGDTVIINKADNMLDWTALGDVSHYYIYIEDLTLGEYAVNPQETQSSGMSLLGDYLEAGHIYRVTVGVIPTNGTIDYAEWDNFTFEVEEIRETPYDPDPTTEPTPDETPEPTPYIGTITYHGIRIENVQSYNGDTVIIDKADNMLDWTALGDVSYYYFYIEDLTLGEYAIKPKETQSSGMSLLGDYLEIEHVYRVTVGVIPVNGTIDNAEWDVLDFQVEGNHTHDFNGFVSEVSATCDSPGEIVWRCSGCDEIDVQAIPPFGHDFMSVKIEATCISEGYTEDICQNCNAVSQYYDFIPMPGHNFIETSSIRATCEEDGEIVLQCLNCGYTETEIIPAIGHEWGEWEANNDIEQENNGEEKRICINDPDHVETRMKYGLSAPDETDLEAIDLEAIDLDTFDVETGMGDTYVNIPDVQTIGDSIEPFGIIASSNDNSSLEFKPTPTPMPLTSELAFNDNPYNASKIPVPTPAYIQTQPEFPLATPMPGINPVVFSVQVMKPDKRQVVHIGEMSPLEGIIQGSVPLNAVRIMCGDTLLHEDEDVPTAVYYLSKYIIDTITDDFWRRSEGIITLTIYTAAVKPGEAAKRPYKYSEADKLDVEVLPKQEDALGSGTGLHLTMDTYEDGVIGDRHISRPYAGAVNFNFSKDALIDGIPVNNTLMTFTGWIQPKANGEMHLIVRATDGIKLTLDNHVLINEWQDSVSQDIYTDGMRVRTGEKLEINLSHYNDGKDGELTLWWQFNNGNYEVIPADYLYPAGTQILSNEAQIRAIKKYDLSDKEKIALNRIAFHSENDLVKKAIESGQRLLFIFEGAGVNASVGDSLHNLGRMNALIYNVYRGEVDQVLREASTLPDNPIKSPTLREGVYTLSYTQASENRRGGLWIENVNAIIRTQGACVYCKEDLGEHMKWHACEMPLGSRLLTRARRTWSIEAKDDSNDEILWITADQYDELIRSMKPGEKAILVVDRKLMDVQRPDMISLYDYSGLKLISGAK